MEHDAAANARAAVRDYFRKSSLGNPDLAPKVKEGFARTLAQRYGAKLVVDENAPTDYAEVLAREEAGERFVRWCFTSEKRETIKELVSRATSSAIHWRACIHVAEGFIDQGDPLPKELGDFVVGVLLGRTKPIKKLGRSASENDVRDLLIAMAVYRATKFGLHPTRNEATVERTSACQIVTEVLSDFDIELSEKSVARIWGDFAHLR